MNDVTSISNIERQMHLANLIQKCGRVTVAEVVEEFAVSEATARRDLEILAERGVIQRVHGGAIAIRHSAPELPILLRNREQAQKKQRIGQAAAALVKDGESVFLGSGTTVLEVARNLRSCKNLTVITNSLPVINMLVELPEITLISLGGMLRESELSFIGHITEKALEEVRADKVIMGIRALNLEQGLTNDYIPETLTDRAILKVGREIIVVADHTKMGCVSAAFVAPVSAIHRLVTDIDIDMDFVSALVEKGIQVITI
jgi:DeoR family transcriptional regulator, aga operon transcriptional repressor